MTQIIVLSTLSMQARQEILADLFRPVVFTEPPTYAEAECAICETPGDFSCFSVAAPWDRRWPQRHVHVCPRCVMEENLGEPIGTRASSCTES